MFFDMLLFICLYLKANVMVEADVLLLTQIILCPCIHWDLHEPCVYIFIYCRFNFSFHFTSQTHMHTHKFNTQENKKKHQSLHTQQQ